MSPCADLPAAPPRTVDELLDLPDHLRYELIEGRFVLLDYLLPHQHLTLDLCHALDPQAPADSLVVHGLSLAVDHHTELRPDVVVIPLDHAADGPAPITDVLLAVDVVTQTTHFRDLYAKAGIRAAAGVTDYWILDPWFDGGIELSRLRLDAGGTYRLVESTREVCTTSLPFPMTVDVAALTANRRALLDRIPGGAVVRRSGRT